MRDLHITHLELEAMYKTVQAFLKELEEISAQLPRYYAVWRDPKCEGVDSLTSSATCTTAGEVTVGSRIEVFWKDDECFYPGVVKEFNEDGKVHVLYDDGDEETLDLSEENYKIIDNSGVSELTDEAADADGENMDRGGDYKENKRGGAVENFLPRSL
eukprot:gene34244-biopygen22127